MTPYVVSQSALSEFLSALAATVPPAAGGVSPRVQCATECLSLRGGDRHSHADCNAFVYEDGLCKLGYREPNWLVAELAEEDDVGRKIYFDFDVILP